MDRISFIKKNLNPTDSKWGQILCECDGVKPSDWIPSTKKINLFQLVVLAIAAFLCAIFFAMYQRNVAKTNNDEWLRFNDEIAIACSSSIQTNSNKSWPEKRNGSCAHQFADLPGKFGSKKNKIHSC